MQLLQQKLCAGLGDINQLQQADMPRLAHAISRLTPGGLSREPTSPIAVPVAGLPFKLRAALLGSEPSNREQLRAQTTGPGQNEPNPAPQTAKGG